MNKEDKRKFKIYMLCAALVLVATGVTYASTLLNISAPKNQAPAVFDTAVTDVQVLSTNGKASNETAKVANNIAIVKATLNQPEDSVTYQVTVKNSGNVTAYVSEILNSTFVDGVRKADIYPISVEYSGITENEMIAAGTTKTFTIKLNYDKSNNTTVKQTITYNLLVKFTQK